MNSDEITKFLKRHRYLLGENGEEIGIEDVYLLFKSMIMEDLGIIQCPKCETCDMILPIPQLKENYLFWICKECGYKFELDLPST